MFSKLRLFLNCRKSAVVAHSQIKNLFLGRKQYSVDRPNVIDINFEDMMYEESEIEEKGNRMLTEEPVLQSTGVNGVPIAPIDINPWIEEDEFKEGTVDEESIERKRIISELPQPPKERSGIYEFKGIKIVLPKKLLRPATYRHRYDQDDIEFLADDIRICKFEKLA